VASRALPAYDVPNLIINPAADTTRLARHAPLAISRRCFRSPWGLAYAASNESSSFQFKKSGNVVLMTF
jgi:hypothetical protein